MVDEGVILLNDRCNLRCQYCGFRGDPHRPRELSWEQVEAGIRTLGARVLVLNADGEALLSRDLLLRAIALARRLAPDGVLGLVTNGTLVDVPLATFLADHRVGVTVSLDGPARVHDVHRVDEEGRGTHARVMEGIRTLRQARVPVSYRAVVTPDTVKDISLAWSFLAELDPARPIKLRPVRPLTGAWVCTFQEAYVALVRDLVGRGVPTRLLPDDALHHARGSRGGPYCAAGRSMLWLTPGGTWSRCGLLPGGPSPDPVDPALATLPADCLGCALLPACGGGCPAWRIPGSVSPLCAMNRALHEVLRP